MIKVKITELLAQQNQTLYWLSKQTGVRYATIFDLSKNNISRLSLSVLDRICAVLNCQPGDLLVYVADGKHSTKLKPKAKAKPKSKTKLVKE
ncbi:MAG: putative transcriptional regulator [bacterium]|nr:MAG: putative transcriptional regulator [bacterium]